MKISEAKRLLREIFLFNLNQMQADKPTNTYLIPYYVAPPGVGKTAIPRQVARELAAENPELGIAFHQTIIAQYDAGELAGLPFLGDVEMEDGSFEKRMIRLRPTYLPDPKKADGSIGIWNLDELPQAFLANLNICSQLVNEYRVGEHYVSPGITLCATGNAAEHKSGTTSLPMHLRDRLMYIHIEVDHDESMAYANQNGWHPMVRAYLAKNPASLHKFTVGVDAFPSPRSWEKTAAIVGMDLPVHLRTEAVRGQIGEEATQFESWLRVADKMPDPFEVARNPNAAPIFGSAEASILYLLITNLADIAKVNNVENIITYLRRMPNPEFGVLWTKSALARDDSLNKTKAVTEYKIKDLAGLLS